jgi:hypothetical protein
MNPNPNINPIVAEAARRNAEEAEAAALELAQNRLANLDMVDRTWQKYIGILREDLATLEKYAKEFQAARETYQVDGDWGKVEALSVRVFREIMPKTMF